MITNTFRGTWITAMSAAEEEELRRRQHERLRQPITPRPAPSRSGNAADIEKLRAQLIAWSRQR
jgi:hypothetical protein